MEAASIKLILSLLPDLKIWATCAVAVTVGTCLQRLSGAGFGMIATPVMTLFAEQYVPGTILLLGCGIGLGAAFGGREAIVRKDLPPGLLGRVTGAGIAALIAVSVVGSPMLPIVVACVVLLAVCLSLAGLSFRISPQSLFAAGAAGGIMGTLTGIGAPPMAILYSNTEPKRSAASQNAFFGFGMVVSIAALLAAGLIGPSHLVFACALAPAAYVGLLISRPMSHRFEKGTIRPWALGLATTAAVTLLWRSV